jgi:hypothetical protein
VSSQLSRRQKTRTALTVRQTVRAQRCALLAPPATTRPSYLAAALRIYTDRAATIVAAGGGAGAEQRLLLSCASALRCAEQKTICGRFFPAEFAARVADGERRGPLRVVAATASAPAASCIVL